MLYIGLTGGIASGKTTIARMFATLNVAVFDADACVHQLYTQPDVKQELYAIYPWILDKDGRIDRPLLSQKIRQQPDVLPKLESLIHPKVQEKEQQFIRQMRRKSKRIILNDIPLLVETNAQHRFDITLMTSAPLWLRKKRALKRPKMTSEAFDTIICHQSSDAEKRRCIDLEIKTGLGMAHSYQQVKQVYQLLVSTIV